MASENSIALIHSGRGNIKSLMNALERIGTGYFIAKTPGELDRAHGIVFPGVGSFGALMDFLRHEGFQESLVRAIRNGVPYLGICVGMQVLFERSEEFGNHEGLGVLKGEVSQIQRKDSAMKVPHVGWNQVSLRCDRRPRLDPPWEGKSPFFYFTHSFVCRPSDDDCVFGVSDYFGEFASLVQEDNILACQFHPERSGEEGLAFLEWFVQSFALR